MNSDFSAARARLDAAEAKREEVLLRHLSEPPKLDLSSYEKEHLMGLIKYQLVYHLA